ncbi:hypothetical protein [Streptomyces sp. NPDC004376]
MNTPGASVGLFPPAFEPDYVSHAVKPYLLGSQSVGERPALPLIDLVLSKENAARVSAQPRGRGGHGLH